MSESVTPVSASAAPSGVSVGLVSPNNTLSIQNSPVDSVGQISVDLAVQTGLTPGTYVGGAFTISPEGIVTSASGASEALTSVTLESTSGTISLSNTSITGSSNVCSVDLQPVPGVAGNYVLPSITTNGYGQITSIVNGSVSGTGTVTSVGVASPHGTLAVSGSPVTAAGTVNVDLAPVVGVLPTSSVACPAVGVDQYGIVQVMSSAPSVSITSPNESLVVGDPAVTTSMVTFGVDVAPTGIAAGTYGVLCNVQVGADGRIISADTVPSPGVIQSVTSSANTLALTPSAPDSSQTGMNLDLQINNANVAGTFNGITFNEYGVATEAIQENYLKQIDLSSPLGTLTISNGAVTSSNNSVTMDLAQRTGLPTAPVSQPCNLVVNSSGVVTSVENMNFTSNTGSISITPNSTNTITSFDVASPPQSIILAAGSFPFGFSLVNGAGYCGLFGTNLPVSQIQGGLSQCFLSLLPGINPSAPTGFNSGGAWANTTVVGSLTELEGLVGILYNVAQGTNGHFSGSFNYMIVGNWA